jgi:hypothetical protein
MISQDHQHAEHILFGRSALCLSETMLLDYPGEWLYYSKELGQSGMVSSLAKERRAPVPSYGLMRE